MPAGRDHEDDSEHLLANAKPVTPTTPTLDKEDWIEVMATLVKKHPEFGLGLADVEKLHDFLCSDEVKAALKCCLAGTSQFAAVMCHQVAKLAAKHGIWTAYLAMSGIVLNLVPHLGLVAYFLVKQENPMNENGWHGILMLKLVAIMYGVVSVYISTHLFFAAMEGKDFAVENATHRPVTRDEKLQSARAKFTKAVGAVGNGLERGEGFVHDRR
jgi:hypothetical protein